MSQAFKVALIGTGRMGKMRARAIAAHPKLKLTRVFDINKQAAAALAAEIPNSQADSVERLSPSLLKQEGIDGVWIASSTHTHGPLIQTCAPAGLRALFCEKPVAFTPLEVETAYSLCEKHNTPLICGWNRRLHIPLQQAFAIHKARDKTPERFYMAHIVNRDHPVPDAKILHTMGSLIDDVLCHDVDNAIWFFGEPSQVQAVASSAMGTSVLDAAVATLRYSCGRIVTIDSTRFAPTGYDQRLEMLSTKDVVTVGAGTHTLRPFTFNDFYADAFNKQVDQFAAVMSKQKADGVATRAEAVSVARVIRALNESLYSGRAVHVQAQPKGVRSILIGQGEFATSVYKPLMNGKLKDDFSLAAIVTRRGLQDPALAVKTVKIDQLQEILKDPTVLAVVVSSPDESHADHTNKCLAAGKHVLCEKPLSSDPTKAEQEVLEATQRAVAGGRVLMVGFQRRMDAQFIKARAEARKLIQSGDVGNAETPLVITSMEPDKFDPAQHHPAKLLSNSIIHDIDVAVWTLQGLVDVSEIRLASAKRVGSEITLNLVAPLLATSPSPLPPRQVHVRIVFAKDHTSYLQQVSARGQVLGQHDVALTSRPWARVYEAAYEAQMRYFAELVAGQVPRMSTTTEAEGQSVLDVLRDNYAAYIADARLMAAAIAKLTA